MSSVKVGQLYEDKHNYRFEVLCVHEGTCFIKWLDEYGTHGCLDEDAVEDNCKPYTADTPQTDRMTEEEFDTMIAKGLLGQTDCPWK